jgi:fermentation-respiration switch protein FrsA (DUF1100 family)
MTKPGNSENEEITWQVDGTPVYGTLTRPPGDSTWPAVAFVAGSGPTDRDWNSPLVPGGNGSARLLAETLAGDGFVTITFVFPENANHVLKYEEQPLDELTPAQIQATYNAEGRRLDSAAVEAIRDWLEAQSMAAGVR